MTSVVADDVEKKLRVVIAPGNGCSPIEDANWYTWCAHELRKTGLFKEVVCRSFPDPYAARESVWIPFLLNECGADASTIIIGHSSGAEAAMRLLENHQLHGCVLVSACHTDLGIENERRAGYYNRP